jgi:hypothetical protein
MMNKVRKIVKKVMKKIMTRQALLNMFELRCRKKQSDWKWTRTDNSLIIYPFTENNGICDDLLSKFEAEPPSELYFFRIYGTLFEKICDETKSAVEQSEQKKLER